MPRPPPSLVGLRSPIFSPSISLRFSCRRFFSSNPDPVGPEAIHKVRSRLLRLNSKLPSSLQRYTSSLIHAPLTHISAFLFLHELTAVVPLLSLTGIFHYAQWLPPYISEGKWVSDGVEKFGGYFRRKGWLGNEEKARRYKWWDRGEGGLKVVVEFATAYAITKALLPVRLIISVSATPWFARVAIVPSTNVVKSIFKRGGKKPPSSGSPSSRTDVTT